jgi:hypothetical protein
MTEYYHGNVYHMGETAMFCRMQPGGTILRGWVKGCKETKARITLAFFSSLNGSDKWIITVIRESAKPHWFENLCPSSYVNYKQYKGVDDTAESSEWLSDLSKEMKRKEVQSFLTSRQCSMPQTQKSQQCVLGVLSPNYIIILQYLDNGFVKSFKSHYRQHWVRKIVEFINPFWPSRLEKFLQPGRKGFLNACRATKWTGLPEKLVQQGHKVKKPNVYFHFWLPNSWANSSLL